MPAGDRIFIGLGSNVGDRRRMVERALEAISGSPQVELVALSSLYRTEPVGYNDQDDFLNAVAEIRTSLHPGDLLVFLKGIEERLGRVRRKRWGPREIDLDIILFGPRVVEAEGLIIPHPEMHRRRFVLAPLAEIAPEAEHPLLGLTTGDMLAGLDDDMKVEPFGNWTGE